MVTEQAVLVKCQFTRGGFPSELVFHIDSPNGGSFTGAAPTGYCYDARKKPFDSEIERGAKVDGFVVGIVFSEGEGDTVRVYLPDSNVYEISDSLIHNKENSARVPLQS